MSKSLSNKIIDNRLLAKGAIANAEEFAKRGISLESAQAFLNIINSVEELNEIQEEMKAKLKTQTQILNKQITGMDLSEKEFKIVVKLIFPKSEWSRFGINDKR